jgi:hypothetical protein
MWTAPWLACQVRREAPGPMASSGVLMQSSSHASTTYWEVGEAVPPVRDCVSP